MRAWQVAGLVLWTVTAVLQLAYVWRLKTDVVSLSARVRHLSSKLDERPVTTDAQPYALAATLARNSLPDPNRLAPPPAEEQVRRLVTSELDRQQDEQRVATETSLELAVEQMRDSLARELGLSDDEVAGLGDLGDRLQAAEGALLAQKDGGQVTEAQLREQHLRLWTEANNDARRLLGEGKFAKFDALRRDRPELARSLYVLRPSPVVPATANAAVAQENTR
jgi:hypothetical protein